MQVKKYEAPTMAEALNLIKTEMGPDAIILSTKKHKKGFGLLTKASVEITAAVSDKSLTKKKITERVVPEEVKKKIDEMSASRQAEVYDEFSDHYSERAAKKKKKTEVAIGSGGYARNGRVYSETASPATAQSAPTRATLPPPAVPASAASSIPTPSASAVQSGALREELAILKAMVEELKADQVQLADSRIPMTSTDEVHSEFMNLLRNGVDKKFATSLMKHVTFEVPQTEHRNREKILETLAVEMMNGIKIENPIDFKPNADQRVFAILGPTGVGKTTTIAKMASQAILQKNLRVGFINIDSYKVAALDQLATYARILNVPFRQVSSVVELDRALTEFKPLDLIFIDTSGRSQKDSEGLSQIKNLLAEFPTIRPMLVVSATTRDQELYDIAHRFRIFNPTGLAFTKLDECSTFGCLYNLSVRTSIPLTFFTQGQRVPEDIENASRERVVGLILDI